jgi:hypothetical protein
MSFVRTLIGRDPKSDKQKALMVNERRRQSQKWLARQSEQKKQPDAVTTKK